MKGPIEIRRTLGDVSDEIAELNRENNKYLNEISRLRREFRKVAAAAGWKPETIQDVLVNRRVR